MKKILLLAMTVVLVGLFFGSVALAQGTTMIIDATAAPTTGPATAVTVVDLAPSGGPSLLLPAAALLLGTGVLTYTILRRGG